ncbi:MAG: HNH endonuclease [Rhodospirillales bacterium]|nr:HNH endonuclease [Rhodospirillales bacterium]
MWDHIDRPSPDACWNWTAATSQSGHGLATIAGRRRYVHRYLYEIFRGPIPSGQIVRHRCDNARCCNPDRLVLGSPADNVADRCARGRSASGETNGRSRLTADQVVDLYTRWHAGEGSTSLAREYGITDRAVRLIIHGRNWRHLRLSELPIERRP